jgi:Flp pilus assembly protein TadD
MSMINSPRHRLKLLYVVFVLLGALAAYAPRASAQTQTGTPARGIGGALTNPTPAPPPSGRYYALVIGNNKYQYVRQLKTAEADAREVEQMLRESYGFQTKLLLNATRAQIIGALAAYRRELGADANLLIYYAGHGYNDRDADKAYWLPVDATQDDPANWISADDITTNTKGIHARHILIISDSCYSGTITRDADPTIATPAERTRYLQKMDEGKSRTLMASGGDEPVADAGGGGHSIFAAALLRGISQMDKDQFTAGEMFRDYIVESVAGNAEQTPEYSPLRNSGHEAGDFIFVRAQATAHGTADLTTADARINARASGDANTQQTARADEARNLTLATQTNAPVSVSAPVSVPANLTVEQYEELGSAALDAHKWAQAEAAYRAALRLQPNKAVNHAGLALALVNQQRYTEAETEGRAGVRLRSDIGLTHSRLAFVFDKEQKLAEAEAERRAALRLQPNAQMHWLLGLSLNRQSKWAEAEAEGRAAIGLQPDDARYHNQLGVALREQQRLAEAVAEFREAARLAPKKTEYAINLSQALNAQKRQQP